MNLDLKKIKFNKNLKNKDYKVVRYLPSDKSVHS